MIAREKGGEDCWTDNAGRERSKPHRVKVCIGNGSGAPAGQKLFINGGLFLKRAQPTSGAPDSTNWSQLASILDEIQMLRFAIRLMRGFLEKRRFRL